MQDSIRFVFDDRIVNIGFTESSKLTPTSTVLTFLRAEPNHKGVKEGCAEGDCGACTVVLAEIGENGKLVYSAIDSCLVFLPMIHGKQLITVENLAFYKEKQKILHPVQKMLIKYNASQCGYCTPGMVMSVFGLFKNHLDPSRETIEDALTGNLCRCTGYQPILEAAKYACSGDTKDHFSQYEPGVVEMLKEITANREPIIINHGRQIYFKPFSLQEAFKFKKDFPAAIVINGSTDVALRQTKKKELLATILDLSGIAELRHSTVDEEAYILGAGLTLERTRLFAEKRLPALYDILKVFGSLQIRNMATLGGNVGSASPIGDTIPLLIAYRAKIKTRSLAGEKITGIEDFILGYRKTTLGEDELITEIIIPRNDEKTFISSYKVSKRTDLDISSVSAAFRIRLDQKKIADVVMAFGGMAEMTLRAKTTEKFLYGKEWSRKTIEDAMSLLAKEFKPVSDARATAKYRSAVVKNLLMKFYSEHLDLP